MVDVVVNVRGVASQLRSEMSNAKSTINSFYDTVKNIPTIDPIWIKADFSQMLNEVRGVAAQMNAIVAQELKATSLAGVRGATPIGAPREKGELFQETALMDYQKILEQMWQSWTKVAYGTQMVERMNTAWANTTNTMKQVSVDYKVVEDSLKAVDTELRKKPKDMQNVVTAGQLVQGFMQNLANSLGATGKRLAWFGFRLTMIGRMFSRTFGKALGKTLQVFKNWDKTIQDIGVGMGFLAASGLLTGKAQEMMTSAMMDLPGIGMQIQGVMAALQALFVNIGADIIPILVPALLDLVLALQEVWNANKGELIPIFETIATKTIPKLIEVIKEVGPAFIMGLVTGLQAGLSALTDFIAILEPHMGTIGEWIGILIGIAPLLTGIGLALFGVSVIFQSLSLGISSGLKIFNALSFLFSNWGKLIPALTTHFGMAAGSLNFLAAAFLPLLILAATFLAWGKEIWGLMARQLFPAIGNLIGSFASLGGELDIVGLAFKVLKLLTAPIAAGIMIIVYAVTQFFNIISAVIDVVRALIQIFRGDFSGAFDIVRAAINRLTAPLEDLKSTIGGMVKDIMGWFGHSIGDTMADQYDIARESLENLLEVQKQPTVIPQSIPIDVQITIENLSSNVDVNSMVDEVSRKIADRMESVI